MILMRTRIGLLWGLVGYRYEVGFINACSSFFCMIDQRADRFSLAKNNGLIESYRASDLICQIKASQGRVYCLLVQFRIRSERNLCVDKTEKCKLADEVKSEIRYLINTFETYKIMKEETRNNIESNFFGSCCTTQNNIRILLTVASELIGQQPYSF